MILITGATGFLGCHLAEHFLREGEELRLIYRNKIRPNVKERLEGAEWFKADLGDQDALEKSLQGVDVVYHVAAMVSLDDADEKELNQVNKEGTKLFVDLCLANNIKKFIYVSSIAALSTINPEGDIDEANPWDKPVMQNAYARTKHAGELEVWRAAAEGLEISIVNPSVILGKWPGFRGSMALFRLVDNGMPFYPKGTTSFVSVGDVVNALVILKNKGAGERYVITGENWSYQKMLTLIATELSAKTPKRALPNWLGKILLMTDAIFSTVTRQRRKFTSVQEKSSKSTKFYSAAKFEEEFNYEFKSIAQEVKEVAAYYLEIKKESVAS